MARLPRGLKPLAKVKDANRGRSAYFLFCDHVRMQHEKNGSVDTEIAGKSMAAASKIYSARWKALTAEERHVFESQSQTLKKQAKSKKENVLVSNKKVSLPQGWTAKRDVSSGCVLYLNKVTGRAQWNRPSDHDVAVAAPKKPNAERMFHEEQQAKGNAMSKKKAHEEFKKLSDEERQVYVEKAKAQIQYS